jgi:hypothetical protein
MKIEVVFWHPDNARAFWLDMLYNRSFGATWLDGCRVELYTNEMSEEQIHWLRMDASGYSDKSFKITH